jgi:hypothetical protein
MAIIDTPDVGPTCRNCGCKRTGARCFHCGSHTGSFPVAKPTLDSTTNRLCKRRARNAGIRRMYDAMIKAGSFKRGS